MFFFSLHLLIILILLFYVHNFKFIDYYVYYYIIIIIYCNVIKNTPCFKIIHMPELFCVCGTDTYGIFFWYKATPRQRRQVNQKNIRKRSQKGGKVGGDKG